MWEVIKSVAKHCIRRTLMPEPPVVQTEVEEVRLRLRAIALTFDAHSTFAPSSLHRQQYFVLLQCSQPYNMYLYFILSSYSVA